MINLWESNLQYINFLIENSRIFRFKNLETKYTFKLDAIRIFYEEKFWLCIVFSVPSLGNKWQMDFMSQRPPESDKSIEYMEGVEFYFECAPYLVHSGAKWNWNC